MVLLSCRKASRTSPRYSLNSMELLLRAKGNPRIVNRRYRIALLSAALIVSAQFPGCSSGKGGGGGGATLYSIGGTVTGLSGSGLVLQNNGTDNSPVTANGIFALSQPVAANSAYSVTVLTQPTNPIQVCTVTNGSGTATSNVTSIQVACATTAFPIGGTVSGLTGSGLVLQDNGGNNLSILGSETLVSRNPSTSAARMTSRWPRSPQIRRKSAPSTTPPEPRLDR